MVSYQSPSKPPVQFSGSTIQLPGQHVLELDKTVLPFLVRKGFHPKLGARPMRDAVEKLVGDAVSECLLQERQTSGALTLDEMRDCLIVL